jgi:periplasmic divalent cation tolerance protein
VQLPEGGPLVVLVTAGSVEEAERLAEVLVQEGLAACVNVLPGVTSIYRWEGAVQRDNEVMMVVKTRWPLLDRFVVRLQALHSYDVAEIIALPILAGSESYLGWLMDVTPDE